MYVCLSSVCLYLESLGCLAEVRSKEIKVLVVEQYDLQ